MAGEARVRQVMRDVWDRLLHFAIATWLGVLDRLAPQPVTQADRAIHDKGERCEKLSLPRRAPPMDRGLADPIETAFDFVEDPFIRGGAPAWVFVPIRMIIGKDGSIRDDPSQIVLICEVVNSLPEYDLNLLAKCS
jgi:hypothetical protein